MKRQNLYVRVSEENKTFIEEESKAQGISMSAFINLIIKQLRARKKK